VTVALFIYLLAIVCWLGGMVFFSFFTAPAVFTVLSRHDAGALVAGIFPRYYLLGYIAGIVATILAFYFMFSRALRGWWSLSAVALLVALLLTLYAGVVIRPRVDSIRTVVEEPAPDPAQKLEFDRLHRLSVELNAGAMVLNLFALFATAAALAG
jgi:uncharacterized membrane protein